LAPAQAEAIATSPKKSDGAIATEIGAEANTVRGARKTIGKPLPIEKRTCGDGKQCKMAAVTA
jgi:hypothetical protein